MPVSLIDIEMPCSTVIMVNSRALDREKIDILELNLKIAVKRLPVREFTRHGQWICIELSEPDRSFSLKVIVAISKLLFFWYDVALIEKVSSLCETSAN